MNEKNKKQLPKWIEKLKKVKHIEIYIAVIFIVIILLIFLSSKDSNDTNQNNSTNEMSVTNYVEKIETDLEKTLSSIAGVSKVKVMITLNLKQLEIVENEINITKFPEIQGILITAKGVDNPSNKMKVLHAVQAVIDIANGNIQILSSE